MVWKTKLGYLDREILIFEAKILLILKFAKNRKYIDYFKNPILGLQGIGKYIDVVSNPYIKFAKTREIYRCFFKTLY